MKRYIRYLFIFILFSAGFESYSQNYSVTGGFTVSDVISSEKTKMRIGFHVGISTETELFESFTLETSIIFNKKGFVYTEHQVDNPDDYIKFFSQSYYIDIPLRLKTEWELNRDLRAYGSIGPYFGIGLFGKQKTETVINGETNTESGSLSFEYFDYLNRLDIGVGVGAGIIKNKLQYGLSYDFGIMNIYADANSDFRATNSVIRLSVAYHFEIKKKKIRK